VLKTPLYILYHSKINPGCFRNTFGKYQKFFNGLTSIPMSVKTKKWQMEKIGLVVTPVGGKRHKKTLQEYK